MEEWDCVVVGGGVMGYSSALALAELGRRTLLLEQFPSPHTRGSSTGQSRITRVANYGAPELNPVMVEALDAWKKIQAEVGKQLFVPAPMLCVGQGKSMKKMRTAITDSGQQPRLHSASEVLAKYGMKVQAGEEVFSDVSAGVLLADQCILALKICAHNGAPCDPNNRDLGDTLPYLEETSAFVKERFPSLHPHPAVKEACMYTETPDNEMILDSVPGLPNIVYGCGFSGTGFKLGPVVGKILAQKVTGGKVGHDIARFRAARFPTSKY